MAKNLGNADRILRTLASVTMLAAFFLAPVALPLRLALLGTAVYMLGTALAGTCLGYKLMGMNTCPVHQR